MKKGELISEQAEAEKLLHREARLIDEWKLDEWLDLFTSDAVYWLPGGQDNYDPDLEVSIIYDDRQHMEDRVWRLLRGFAHPTDPRTRLRHIIGNIELDDVTGERLLVSSNLVVHTARLGVQAAHAGRAEHHLRSVDGVWKIAFKKVELVNCSEPIHSLQFII